MAKRKPDDQGDDSGLYPEERWNIYFNWWIGIGAFHALIQVFTNSKLESCQGLGDCVADFIGIVFGFILFGPVGVAFMLYKYFT